MYFSRIFSFISQVSSTLAVQPQAGISFFFFLFLFPHFLGKIDSFAVSSLVNRKLLFISQRPAFLLLSMAMEVVKIQSHLCLP